VSAGPVRTSGGAAVVRAPVLLLYGEEYANLALADELALDGYEVRRASNAATLRAACHTREIDVLILGQAAHRRCGLEVLRQLRAGALAPQAEPGLRALWMSPNGKLRDVLRGFEAGADDVIRTPYAYPELRARVQALTRRDIHGGPGQDIHGGPGQDIHGGPGQDIHGAPGVIEFGELRIDTAAHEVTVGATRVGLRPLEYELLVHLAREPTRVHTKNELLGQVWGIHTAVMTRTLDSHASRLRCALARAGAEGWVRVTRGFGYRLAPNTLAPHTTPINTGGSLAHAQ
jgi:DNA-binding response OmpR family regulator